MNRNKVPEKLPRREFLKKASLATGAVAAVTLSAAPGEAAAVTEATGAASGYRETAHIRKYYELARS